MQNNAATIKESNSLPPIEDTLYCLSGALWFTALHLKSRYSQVKKDEESKPLTVFMLGLLGVLQVKANAVQPDKCSNHISASNGNLFR